MIGVGREGEGRRSKGGEGVAKDGEGFSVLQAIGEVACGEFCKAGESVGDALDGAEPDWACADSSQEGREYGGGGFVAPVAEEAGEADAEDGAVEPGLLHCGFGHGEAVYSRKFLVESSELAGRRFCRRFEVEMREREEKRQQAAALQIYFLAAR